MRRPLVEKVETAAERTAKRELALNELLPQKRTGLLQRKIKWFVER